MRFGDFELSIVRECTFKLDGGAMFGVVPKTLWSRESPADQENRVLLACNLLVIESPAGVVLVETGMGSRWSARERQRYEINSLVEPDRALNELGLSNDDVSAVIISHLHFDHAGGAVIEVGGELVPAYPRAKYYVQSGEWALAAQGHPRAKASYRAADYEPLAKYGVLQLIDGDTEIVPGVWARVTGGHTRHHQVVAFESQGQKGIYWADIMPTRCHVSPPWVMGYDHFPLTSCDVKEVLLSQAVDSQWLVVFDHEPGVPWGQVSRAADGKFVFNPLPESSLSERQPLHV